MDESVCECLRGAGCDADLMEATARLCDAGHAAEALRGLGERRMSLLAELRACDQKLDCLDRAILGIRNSR